jgi:hypothetical protein
MVIGLLTGLEVGIDLDTPRIALLWLLALLISPRAIPATTMDVIKRIRLPITRIWSQVGARRIHQGRQRLGEINQPFDSSPSLMNGAG